MINVTFIGNIYDSTGAVANDVKYQGLFIKVNSNSSDTVWDAPRISENNQYNFNLGDNTWLSQQGGYAQPYDKVVLCFWLNNTSDRTDLDLVEWAFIEWELDSRDVYIQDIQLRPHSNPTCSFVLSGGKPISIYDTGTHDDYQWVYDSKDHYQAHLWEGHEIFPINKLPDNPVDINWGDGTSTGLVPLSGSPWLKSYSVPDDYDITITVQNTDSLTCSAAFSHRATYHVVNGLNWSEPLRINQTVTYVPNITGDLVSISGVDYYINGIITHSDLAYNETFEHTFTSPGNHIIKQCIKYNDGFEQQIQCEDFTVILDTVANFVDSDYDCGKVFTDTSEVGAPPIIKYQWDVTDGMFLLAHVEGTAYSDWYYAWPYRGTFRVRLAVTDSNDRTSSVTKEYVVSECPNVEPGSSGTGGGGGSSPWVYAETRYVSKDEPLPALHIIQIDDLDSEVKKKKILITEINDEDSIL